MLDWSGMSAAPKRSTIYLDPAVHRVLRLKAAETDRSISELVNEAVRQALAEDLEDLSAFADRVKEPSVSFEATVRKLKRDGKL